MSDKPLELWTLQHDAELNAEKALTLDAFSTVNLTGIKKAVAEMLVQFGKHSFFLEYTVHDIRHINKMLGLLDWVIPEKTKSRITGAEWLLIVLSIYFHDLGLLVTRDEFENRNGTAFPDYKLSVLNTGPDQLDLQARLETMSEHGAEEFLYQEFVRTNHAARIRDWIEGKQSQYFGKCKTQISQINELLSGLPTVFRRDLALVCESHHMNNLNDDSVYKLEQPYGDSDDETANLQYVAILLRTTDLLHITKDRAPSITFSLINPKNPFSQIEWWKQNAVSRVKPQKNLVELDLEPAGAQSHTIEVYATFENPEGFFGLTSYLSYCQTQLQQSFEWADSSNRKGVHHSFPWRKIDDSNIEATGFLKESFEFSLDQHKVLDLLIGHTLYNDSSVVVRELLQNSIDAIKLQNLINCKSCLNDPGLGIQIVYDSNSRILEIQDNGTGMTQDVIERHLLKVGSSRYQDESFKKLYPEYQSISRFGIGVLTAFMISDEVDIITASDLDPKARHITLRGVHGKYLIRLLDKDQPEVPAMLNPRGTKISLKVRKSAKLDEIEEVVRKWIVMPQCDISLIVNNGDPIQIGFENVSDAISLSKEARYTISTSTGQPERNEVRVFQRTLNGVTLAYLCRWNSYFNNWSFVRREGNSEHLGICIEGIRVLFGSPGLPTEGIVGIANATGLGTPRTNVARSGIEESPEGDALFRSIYQMMADHISGQVRTLIDSKVSSISAAAREGEYMLRYLGDASDAHDPAIFSQVIGSIPLYILDDGDERKLIDLNAIRDLDEFWTLESSTIRSTNLLLESIRSDISSVAVLKILDSAAERVSGPIITKPSYSNRAYGIYDGKSPSELKMVREQTLAAIKWTKSTDDIIWKRINCTDPTLSYRQLLFVHIDGDCPPSIDGFSFIVACDCCFVLKDSPLMPLLLDILERYGDSVRGRQHALVVLMAVRKVGPFTTGKKVIDNLRRELGDRRSLEEFPFEQLVNIVEAMDIDSIYRLSDWSRTFNTNYE